MNIDELKNYVLNNKLEQEDRYLKLIEKAKDLYGDGDWHLISSPGRSEVGGNHTDHQHGNVLACALDIDNLILVKKAEDNKAYYYDDKFEEIIVDLNNLEKITSEEFTSTSLIRGIASRFKELGYQIGGFKAVANSNVLIGSGISSSACFEVGIVEVFNYLYNQDLISVVDRAIISQYAENIYFNKPCGLMDQTAISVGGFTAIDFKDPTKPIIEKVDFSFEDYGYEFLIIDVKADHADLSPEYAAVTKEIKLVANEMGVEYLRDKDPEYFFNNLAKIRKAVKNDRAVLRAIHFYNENKRAILEKEAIKNKNIEELLKLMRESGRSSYMYLQNIYPTGEVNNQPISLALAICESTIKDNGAYRIHGGGFAGTIQVIVNKDQAVELIDKLKKVFGDDAVMKVKVRSKGTVTLI